MIKKMIKKTLGTLILIPTVLLAGCAEMIMESIANSFSTYDETAQNWPEIPAGQGRIVLFTPSKNPIFSYCEITIDNKEYGGMLEGTFIFQDLDQGEHLLACANNKAPSLSLDVAAGETVYLKKYKSVEGKSPFILIEEQDIYENMKDVNHAFESAIPYDQQPRVNR